MEDSGDVLLVNNTAAASLDEPDDSLLCPITHTLMRDPVILTSGHAVELAALLEFWRGCPFALCNPLTRERMHSAEDVALVPGLHLRGAIDAYICRLPVGAKPPGWAAREPGPRSTREELRGVSKRWHSIATSATSIRLGGQLPPTASALATACLGVYERDDTLTHGRCVASHRTRELRAVLLFSSHANVATPPVLLHTPLLLLLLLPGRRTPGAAAHTRSGSLRSSPTARPTASGTRPSSNTRARRAAIWAPMRPTRWLSSKPAAGRPRQRRSPRAAHPPTRAATRRPAAGWLRRGCAVVQKAARAVPAPLAQPWTCAPASCKPYASPTR